ncbi:BadF/BadG/BcrA/BcrD ATPase family protein [Halomontanus rarus]|uniref:BadF/BadG/BcrA/BcrD ATPase family protein n=1 Tax=Halomontanus rarus TaxID=3034020 RepID=UPI0023E8781F|nr:BadF/BadG/BcrA/BcrD ATPase family protein [Halovivax sp. TS33]
MATYIVGVDTGGTKTKCVVVDESYSLLGVGDAGPGNYRVAGTDGARANVERAIREALADATVDSTETIVGGFGMGTLDTDEDYEIITGFLDDIEFVDERYVDNDVATAYFAITAGEPGVVVIAGTGAMAFGRTDTGERGRSSGWGWLFGDEGSGFDAARLGLRAASKAYDGRGEPTDLVDAACTHFGLESFDDVFTDVLDEIGHAKDIASFAQPVAETAAAGDAVATRIVDEAADELVDAAGAVVEKLDLAPSPRVGCLGGFGTSDVVATGFESKLRARYPEVVIPEPVSNPVVGSVALVVDRHEKSITPEDLLALDAEIEAYSTRE